MFKSVIKKYLSAEFGDHMLSPKLDSLLLKQNSMYDMELDQKIRKRQLDHPNKFVRYGRKGFSQTDEDGLTLEIIRRLNLFKGTFAEFGVGDGSENNTLCLLGVDWRGFWVGGEDLIFDPSESNRLFYIQDWITRNNIGVHFSEGLRKIKATEVDVVSLDLDGNDLYLCELLLTAGVSPALFIVEYNAKFPPPMRFAISYDDNHTWEGDDYYGASLTSFVDLFEEFEYRLICCNAASGVNAFFIRKEMLDRFPEVPKEISEIYTSPHFFLYQNFGHPASKKTLETIISGD